MSTAQIILAQLGGNRFVAMVGAHNFVNTDGGLMFMFKGCRLVNKCRITLDPYDTHTVEFFKMGKYNCTDGPIWEGICADNLQDVFTSATGLDTKL